MNEDIEPRPDTDAEKSRIVRALYDATETLMHATDAAERAGAQEAISRLQVQVDALADRDFSIAFQAALQLLTPPVTGDAS